MSFIMLTKVVHHTKLRHRGGLRVQLYIRGYDLHPRPPSTNRVPPPKEYQIVVGREWWGGRDRNNVITQEDSKRTNVHTPWRGGGRRMRSVHFTERRRNGRWY